MKIAIRADGGESIGMGHIMRTLVLAQELSKNNEVFYICNSNKNINNRFQVGIIKIKSNGFNVITVDEETMIQDMRDIYADCLITDSYDVNEEYFNLTKEMFKYTGYIDDNNLYYFNVDFIINQNIYAQELKYKTNSNAKLFLGTDYAMLREEFQNVRTKKVEKNVKDVLITVGGSDLHNLTEKILKKLSKLKYTFHVVVGPSFNNVDILKKISNTNKNIRLHFNANMCELMQTCDLAISACGSTLYELCACCIPTIGIIIADNQESIAKYMGNLELIYNLGWYNDIRFEAIDNIVESFAKDYKRRLNMSQGQSTIINKKGAKLLSDLINKYFSLNK